ncbi:MAG: glycosyltransferase family 4 protein [Rhodanobacteraceae bacterium]
MRIALAISSLGGGGAERVMAALANAWAERGHEVTLVTLSSSDRDRYVLDPGVRRIALGVAGLSTNVLAGIGHNVTRLFALRRAITTLQPDVVISFIAKNNVLVLASLFGTRMPIIVSERTFPVGHGVHGVWRVMYRLLYPRAAAVVVQTQRCAGPLATLAHKVAVIPNPILSEPADGLVGARGVHPLQPGRRGDRRTLLAVGRLAHQKGFDLLIRAFARIAGIHADWDLVILGEGKLREDLARMIDAAGLASRVSMPGFDPHVRDAMRRADLFVLSSRFEGIPNALLEAMSESRACVSFDCDTGPRELIEHGRNGWLVPAGDVPALAEALDVLMRDADLRERLGIRAREVRIHYSLSAILDQWDELVASSLRPAPQMQRALQR